MGKMDWQRPRFRREGRETESIAGDDYPVAVRSGPRRPAPSKASLRSDADRAVQDFVARKGASAITRADPQQSASMPAAPQARRLSPTKGGDDECPF
jgi:hypothetical protein